MSTAAPSSTRDRRRMRTRRELAGAAVRLFEQYGFAETTVEQIAEAADYSASTFFRMFTRKDDAVFFDMPERLDLLRTALDAAVSRPLWPMLRSALVDHARTWEQDEPEFAAARVRLFHREPALASRYREYCQDYETLIADRIARDRGSGPEHDVAAQLIAGCIVAALRTAFQVQASVLRPTRHDSVVKHLEDAFDELEAGPLHGIT